MQNLSNPLVTMYQAQLEASRQFAEAFFSGTEKIDRVVIGATRRAFDDQMHLAEAMTMARDPRSAGTTLQSSFFSRNPDTAMSTQKEIMRIIAEMQNEIGKSLQGYIEQLRTNAAASATGPLVAARARTDDNLFNPMNSMFSVWESAFKEVATLARKNMSAGRAAVEDSVGAMQKTVDAASMHPEDAGDEKSGSHGGKRK
jgi:hypothetical protein